PVTFLQKSGITALKVGGSHSSRATICTGVTLSSSASPAVAGSQHASGATNDRATRRIVVILIAAPSQRRRAEHYACSPGCQERENRYPGSAYAAPRKHTDPLSTRTFSCAGHGISRAVYAPISI